MLKDHGSIIQYSSTINDHGGLGFSAKRYRQKPASHFLYNSLKALIRHCRPQKCLQINPEPFQQVVMNFLKFPIQLYFLLTN